MTLNFAKTSVAKRPTSIPHGANLFSNFPLRHTWYGDGLGNTIEENSSVFSRIQIC